MKLSGDRRDAFNSIVNESKCTQNEILFWLKRDIVLAGEELAERQR